MVWRTPQDQGAGASPTAPARSPVQPSATLAPLAPPADTDGAPAVRRAARGRAAEQGDASDDDDVSGAPGGGTSPDVDALARKVYDLLRRRLAAERRRGF
jgi:hypothetical protein